MANRNLDSYLQSLDTRIVLSGFSEFRREMPGLHVDRLFHRRKFVLAKFGIVDTFCVVKCVSENLTATFLESFSSQAFEYALNNKAALPRGLGGTAVAYPVVVTFSASDDVRAFVRRYCPKHWASFEFPVLVELLPKSISLYDDIPLWGAFYYKGFQKEVERLFSPE